MRTNTRCMHQLSLPALTSTWLKWPYPVFLNGGTSAIGGRLALLCCAVRNVVTRRASCQRGPMSCLPSHDWHTARVRSTAKVANIKTRTVH